MNSHKNRLVVIALFTFALFSLLIVQFFKIQVCEGQKWTKRALNQHRLLVTEPFKRGTFYSNTLLKKGHPEREQPLAFDVTKFHLFIDPLALPENTKPLIAQKLIELAHIQPSNHSKVYEALEKKSHSRKITSWLDRRTKETLSKWWGEYARKEKIAKNALYFVTDYKRCYPFGKLLGQVLHTIRDDKEEKTQQGIPTGGLEAYFNHYLKGKQGSRTLMRSPLNPLEDNSFMELPVDGADVYLTINHTLQAIVEEELEKGVKAARAKGGWAIMMDPYNGEILALAQFPFFDPENYREYFNDPEKIECTKTKPIVDAFELGSIMKPITIATCLKANQMLIERGEKPLFDPHEKIQTTRTQFPGRGKKPLQDLGTHRYLNMYMALQKSSNIYLAILAERLMDRLGSQWYRNTLAETFGFGQKCGIELPAEASGFLPTPGKSYASKAPQWSLSTPYSLCMGYNLTATSLQMVRAYAVFANGGILVKPTLLKKIVKKNPFEEEKILVDNTKATRVKQFKRVLDEKCTHEIVKVLKYVTSRFGTGHRAQIYGHTQAGKSGTAEKIENGVYSKKRHISSFIGFSPASFDEKIPARFVLLISMDEPEPFVLKGGGKNHMGGRCAAPVFANIAARTLEYLGISPDDPTGYPPGDPRFDPSRADWIPETQELRRLYEAWNFTQ